MTVFKKTVLSGFVSKNILKGGAGDSDGQAVSALETSNSCRFTVKNAAPQDKAVFHHGKR